MKESNTLTRTEKNRMIRNRVLLLILSFILQLGLYVGLLFLGIVFHELFYTIGFTVYLSAGAILLVLYYVLNGATFSASVPDVASIDRSFAEKVERSRKKAKKLHYVLLPMAVLLILVFTDMYFGDTFKSLMSFLG